MKTNCLFCKTELEYDEGGIEAIICGCGAYGQYSELADANLFEAEAKEYLKTDDVETCGESFDDILGTPVLIQWAKIK